MWWGWGWDEGRVGVLCVEVWVLYMCGVGGCGMYVGCMCGVCRGCVCVCDVCDVCGSMAFMPQWACKDHRTTPESQFSPSTMCIPGQNQVIKLGSKHINPMSHLPTTNEAFSSFLLPPPLVGEECVLELNPGFYR